MDKKAILGKISNATGVISNLTGTISDKLSAYADDDSSQNLRNENLLETENDENYEEIEGEEHEEIGCEDYEEVECDNMPIPSENHGKKVKNHRTITSFDEMSSWLIDLEESASKSVQEALKAQLQVIKFVQSPTLVDTTLDTLIFSLKKSLKLAKDKEEQESLREQFSVMIQNYVFFFDARVQYVINETKDEARQLFCQAGEMLSNSVKEVALMAVDGASIAEMRKTVVENLFSPENEEQTKSYFNRIWNFVNQKSIVDEKRKEFNGTIYGIIKKLDKYQPLIGKSMLIYGMIERYKPNVKEHLDSQHQESNKTTIEQFKAESEKAYKQKLKKTIILIVVLIAACVGLCAATIFLGPILVPIWVIVITVVALVGKKKIKELKQKVQNDITAAEAENTKSYADVEKELNYIQQVAEKYDEM